MLSDNKEFQRSVVDAIGSKNTILRTCDIHGQYSASVLKLGSVERETPCPACFEADRSKQIKAAQIEFENERKRHREKLEQRRMEEKTGAARIPKRFQGKTFADYIAETPQQQRALEICTNYAHNFADNLDAGRCLILSGNVGTGKTHLAASIADYIVRETEYTAVFRSLHSILQAIKSTYGVDAVNTESEVMQLFTSPDLLIIDEVGATKSSEFELATLFAIINTRYENKTPTVVVTNLEVGELRNAIGDRCTDRLREGGGRAIAFNWESKRSEI